MKAMITEKYGTPDLLELREVTRPEPNPNQVLLKVLAASVNKADWHLLRGEPLPVRLMAGLLKPKYKILGADVSGIIERVGNEATQFRPGDEVFGDLSGCGFGGFAEYAVAEEKYLAKKPSNLTFEEAASLPMASITALQGLRNAGKIKAGDQVLINGASGGVGSYAIQIAKSFGATVTAVCSTRNAERAKHNGADVVIDYSQQNFTQLEKQHDLILDVVANHSIKAISRVLKKGGHCVSIAFSLGAMFLGPWKSITEGKKVSNILASTNQADLQFICKLAEEGKLTGNVQECFTLEKVPEALWKLGKGHAAGKLVITI